MTIKDRFDGRNPRTRATAWIVVSLALATFGCASAPERSTRTELHRIETQLAELPTDPESASQSAAAFDGTLQSYLAYAFERSPALRASFEQWRAATYMPQQERRLPEPTVTYAGFVRAVETRVGPQRHRLSAQQWFPWPTKLTAGGKAAGLEAEAAQRRFEAHALQVAAEVSTAYWALWRVERQREVLSDEVAILTSLSEQVRVRVEVGAADLADLAQIDLMVSRARDRLVGLDETERIASAQLVAAVGAPDGTPTPVRNESPIVLELDEPVLTLTAEVADHPRVTSYAAMSDASTHRVRKARSERLPSFGVGADWILTGESQAAMVPPDSGKDAVILSLSVRVPLWGGSYRAGEEQARAQGAAFRALALDARNRAMADVREQAARVEGDIRRVRVYETTLVPQAETAFESVLASYSAGRSSVAELLLAEQQLIGLQGERFSAEADYGTHFAMLERAVGRPVRVKGLSDEPR